MRHRAPRPLLARWRRVVPGRPARRGALVAAFVALVCVVGALGLAALRGQRPGHPPAAQAGFSPALPGPSSAERSPEASRSSTRAARRGPSPSAGAEDTPSAAASTRPATTPSTPALPQPTVVTPTPSAPLSTGAAVDSRPPRTTASTVSSAGRSWQVRLGADEPASFACSLDGAGYAPCQGSTTFGGLKPGRHTLAVRATDTSGNTDPTPARLTTQVTGAGH